jgi:hypothetical protein
LRQNGLAEVLGSNAGTVRNDKNNAGLGAHEGGLTVLVSTTMVINEVCRILFGRSTSFLSLESILCPTNSSTVAM